MKNLIQQLHKSMQNMHFSAMQNTRFSNVLTPSVLVLFLFLFGVGNVWGGTFTSDGDTYLYLNKTHYYSGGGDTKIDYSAASAIIWVYMWGGTAGECWYEASYVAGDIWRVHVTTSGTYTKFIILRKNPNGSNAHKANWDDVWNKTNDYDFSDNMNYKTTDSWGSYGSPSVVGGFNSWNAATHEFKNGSVHIELSAGTHEFKILDGTTFYGNNGTITSSAYWTFSTDYGNCKITVPTAGTYEFCWDDAHKALTVVAPGDDAKKTLTKQTYLYFDARRLTTTGDGWRRGNFTARFYFKNYATGSDVAYVDCTHANALEDWVYYAVVPNNESIGQVQMNRLSVSGEALCIANLQVAIGRTSASQNALQEESGKTDYCNDWTPQWTTYCPPMSSVTLSDNSTAVIDGTTGNGGVSNPFVVATGTDLQVTASATSAVNDANMTKMFDFMVDDTRQQNSTTATYTKSNATSSGVTTYQIKVDAYNTYNSTDGTALTSSILYYEVHNAYTINYKKGTSGTGDNTSATKYHAIDLTLPGVTFTRAGYTQTGWATSEGGAKAYDLGATYSANEAQDLYPVWEENRYHFTASLGNNWSTTDNWSEGVLPTINDIVYIDAPVVVDRTDARAKQVIIDQTDSKTGKITINAGKELVVATSVTKTPGTTTAPEDLVFLSDASHGLGALVTGTLTANQATVNFYTLSHGTSGSSASVAQYLGTPFTDATVLSDFYNSWVYKAKAPEGVGNIMWDRLNGSDGLNPFEGYCVISADAVGHSYEMQGTLVNSKTIHSREWYSTGVGLFANNENLLANSWMAPIKINAFNSTDFIDSYATIYIFNSGSKDDYGDSGEITEGSGPAQYNTYTVETAKETDIIPAMQSFSVFTSGSVSTIGYVNLDYDQLVYDPALDGTVPGPNKAPRRNNMIADEAGKMYVHVVGESGYRDRVYLWQHEDFADGFENGWDGHKLFGESIAPQLYAQTPDGMMAVNCAPEFDGTVLGFTKGSLDNTYTFRFAPQTDEVLYLNDMRTQTSTLINAENTYTFTAGEDDSARFLISRTPYPKMPTGVSDTQASSSKARKIFINGQLYVLNGNALFDITGKRVNVQ